MKVRHLFESLRKNIYNPIKQFGVLYGLKIISYKISNLLQMRIHRYGYLGNKNIKTAIKVLKSRKWSRLPYPSPLSAIFTKQFLEFQSGNYGLCVSNGTEAIKVALKAAGLKYGDEIIISSLTFHSTANAALELGIIPVFVDIDRTTLCIDTEKISKLINKKTKAILTVHLGSVISDLDELVMLCDKYNLKFIEELDKESRQALKTMISLGIDTWKNLGGKTDKDLFFDAPTKTQLGDPDEITHSNEELHDINREQALEELGPNMSDQQYQDWVEDYNRNNQEDILQQQEAQFMADDDGDDGGLDEDFIDDEY